MSSIGNTMSGILNIIRTIEDGTSVSLPQYTKRSTINSRVFIQKECANDEILSDVLRVSMNMYVGFVMSALSMNQYVTGSRTVRDVMMTASTESLNITSKKEYIDTDKAIASYFGSQLSRDLGDLLTPEGHEIDENTAVRHDPSKDDPDARRAYTSFGPSTQDHVTKVDIPSGRVIQMSLGSPNIKGPAITLTMFLQLTPTFIPSQVAEAFIGVNFTPSIKQRYMQMQAGEISFWKDFIFTHDLSKKRKQALRKDKSGTLYDMIKNSQSKVSDAFLKYSLLYKDKANIANTILIFDKMTFNRACNTYGLKFNKYSDRQKFFDKTMSMMIAVIDSNYNTVDFAFHSLEAIGTYQYSQIKNAAKSDKYDLTDIMKAYGQGMAPRF